VALMVVTTVKQTCIQEKATKKLTHTRNARGPRPRKQTQPLLTTTQKANTTSVDNKTVNTQKTITTHVVLCVKTFKCSVAKAA
jgi:hypothetical protein